VTAHEEELIATGLQPALSEPPPGGAPALDAMRAVVASGAGVVVRFPGILCLAVAPRDRTDGVVLARLLQLCGATSARVPVVPGRLLARRLAGWLASDDGPADPPGFGTVAQTDDGLAAFLCGPVTLVVPGSGTRLSGADAAAWTDRLIGQPDAVVLALTGVDLTNAPTGSDPAGAVLDLRVGAVPGSGVLLSAGKPQGGELWTAEAGAATAYRPPEPAPAPPSAPGGAGAADPERVAPARYAAIHGVPPDGGPRPPLQDGPRPARAPAASAVAPPGTAADGSASADEQVDAASGLDDEDPQPQAEGHLCSRGHLNDPQSHFCVICGIRMNERTGKLVLGPRPPLGLIVFDDGATYTIDTEYLVGRGTEGDPRVKSGELRPIRVDDPSGSVSRVHAEVRLRGWEVLLVDSGSRNGTQIALPGKTVWTRLTPSESVRLVPGTQVRLGARTFVFESPSGVR